MAARAARERVEQLHREGMISAATWTRLAPAMDTQVQTHLDAQHELLGRMPALQVEELEDARREGLRAQRAMLSGLLRDGVISEQAYEELIAEVDAGLELEPGEDSSQPQSPEQGE